MAEETPNLDKKKVETIKLLLSSLFARKQKYLIIDGKNKNRLIYTNMPYERTIYYRATPEDTLCGVTVDNVVAPLLYEAFPMFGEIVAEIALQPFMSALNKCLTLDKKNWPKILVNKETEKLTIEVPDKENPETVEIGRLIPPDSVDGYENIMKKFFDFVREPIKLDLELPKDRLDDSVILTDLPIPDVVPVMFKFPIRDGFSLPSFKEYLKKRELPTKYDAIVQYKSDPGAARIALHYVDDWVDCMSMMPGLMWFPFRNM